ncbi:uncharacterized protein TNCV_3471591 [Trichonephila clavipes]|nr:uncharacterized protein TNCV_3471591 [Trichonephila clavipes]
MEPVSVSRHNRKQIKDLQGEEIKGTYYEAELQKVVDSGFYPVENVIEQRKRGGITEYFVKFLGYPEKFNEWVTDIQKNRRDKSQITHLGRQLYPRKVKFFQECYADATSKPYGYLLIDLKPETDESLRVHSYFSHQFFNSKWNLAKKFVLVPEERVQVTEHLSELDQRMKFILHNKDLTEEEKTILYLQVLQKYTHFSNENRRESEPVPNAASLSENQETESLKENLKESVVKTEKEVFEDEILELFQLGIKKKQNIFSSF